MKAIVLTNGYGFENLQLEERAIPEISANEVLIRLGALSLNQLDLMIAKGAFGTQLPHVLGSDAAGTIEKTGSDVKHLKAGDVVSTHFIQSWQSGRLEPVHLRSRLGTDVSGVFSEYIALPEDSVVKAPANLSLEEASALPIAGLTAWEALVQAGHLRTGQTVLLQGTGGVSVFALQFAKLLGAKVIITSGSEEKLVKARALGADETIHYKSGDNWQAKVLALTNGKGVDLALEMSWADMGKTVEAMKVGGNIIVIGLLGGPQTDLNVFGIMQKSITIRGIQVGSKATFREMNQAIEVNKLRPVIDRVFPVSAYKEAFRHYEEASHFGKVVLKF